MKGFESIVSGNFDAGRVYKKAQGALRRSEVNMEDFTDIHGGSVDEDIEYVRERERGFAERADKDTESAGNLASVLEAIFNDHAELSEWLGSGVFMVKASRFDDIKNGVDSIAEFQEGEGSASHLALAIDATMSSYTVREKLEKIKRGIERGKLTEVKYFKSEHKGTRGSLSKIPKVVVGADAETIKSLSNLWLSGDKRALASHPVQFQILEEILLQLHAFNSYASEINRPEIAEIYDDMHKVVEGIHEERASLVDDTGERDSAFRAIKKYAGDFSGQLQRGAA